MSKLQLTIVALILATIVAGFAAFAPVQAQSTVACMSTDSLVQALGTYSSRVKFDLFDDQHIDPAGWRILYDGTNPISWVVPDDYVVQYGDPMITVTGDGQTEVTFYTASIWMPWQCRTGGATSTPEPSPSITPSPTITTTATPEPTETPIPASYEVVHYPDYEVTYLEFACGTQFDVDPEEVLMISRTDPNFPSVIVTTEWTVPWSYTLCGGATAELPEGTVRIRIPGEVILQVSDSAFQIGWQTMERWFWLEGYMPDELKPTPTPSPTAEPTAEPTETPTPSPTPIPQPGQFAPVEDWAEYMGWIFHGLVDPPMGYQVEVLANSTLPNGYKAVGAGITIDRDDSNRAMPPGWYTVYGFEQEFLPLVTR